MNKGKIMWIIAGIIAVLALAAAAFYYTSPKTQSLRGDGGLRPVVAVEGGALSQSPPAEDLIAGNPEWQVWVSDLSAGMTTGIWQSTPGKWRFANDHWEYCRIISGVSVITEEGKAPVTVKAGDSFVLRPGFKGTWEVIETTRKDYVIKKP